MPQERTTESLMLLLRCAVFGKPLPQNFAPTSEQWADVCQLAARHNLLHLVEFTAKSDSADHGFGSEAVDQAVFQYLQQENAVQKLRTTLENAQIPFIFLKGVVLRSDYPEPWMRFCSDIDVLVPPQEYARTIAVLSQVGFVKKVEAPHDALLLSKEGVRVEIHHTLILPQQSRKASELLKGVWEVSAPTDGHRFEHCLPYEYFYLYHIAHMVKHFWDGGCGIRPFLDLQFLMRRSEYKQDACRRLLAQCDLLRFAEKSEQLSNVWFSDGSSEGLASFSDYILSGGTFGTTENSVVSWQGQNASRAKYLLSRVFPLSEKENPLAQKHPWLLPVLWGRRWLRLLNRSKRQLVRQELRAGRSVSNAQLEQFSAMADNLGLTLKERN